MATWNTIDNGFPDGIGTQGGRVRADEEHPLGARITLEEGGTIAPWSITCGIHDWTFHTAHCSSEAEGRLVMDRMKLCLEAILDMIPDKDDPDVDARREQVVNAIQGMVATF